MKKASTQRQQAHADHHQGGMFHHGIDGVQRQPDHDDRTAVVVVHDAQGHDPPVAALGATDLEGYLLALPGLDRGKGADGGVGVLVAAERIGRQARAEEHQ